MLTHLPHLQRAFLLIRRGRGRIVVRVASRASQREPREAGAEYTELTPFSRHTAQVKRLQPVDCGRYTCTRRILVMLLAGVSGRRRSRYSCKGSHRHQRRIGGGTGWKWERDAQDQRGNRGYNISGAEGAAMTTTLSGREPRSVEQSWRRHAKSRSRRFILEIVEGGSEDSLTWRRKQFYIFFKCFSTNMGADRCIYRAG